MPSDTYTLTISDVGVSTPAVLSVTNASVAANAAIAFSKLATLTSGNILVGNGSNAAASVAVTGDVAISNTGVTSIAALAFSKLAPLTSGNILVGNGSNAAASVAVTGDITVSNAGVTAIASGAIVNADVNASAAIAHSKLASMSSGNILVGSSGSVPTSVAVTGDVTVSSVGVTTIANDAVTFAKMQPVSGYTLLGKPTTSSGDATEISCSSFMLESSTGFLRQSSASTARGALGLGTLATQNSVTASTGGTGQSIYVVGDILYASGTTTLSKLASGAANTVLRSTGTSTAPSYGSVVLTTDVTGTLPVANGGTNLSSYATGDILYASGTTALAKLSAAAAGTVLLSGTAPSYGKVILTTGSTQHVTGTLPVANGGTGASTLTGYVKGAGTSALTAIATIPVADGGTNQVSLVRGQISKMNAFDAVTVSAPATYYPLTNAGTLDTAVSTNMTLGATSTFSIRNTSGVTRVFRIYASVDATASNDDILGIMLYAGVAGSLSARVETECRAFTNAVNDPAKLVTSWMISLANNEEVAVYVANHSATQDITAQRARLIAEAII